MSLMVEFNTYTMVITFQWLKHFFIFITFRPVYMPTELCSLIHRSCSDVTLLSQLVGFCINYTHTLSLSYVQISAGIKVQSSFHMC